MTNDSLRRNRVATLAQDGSKVPQIQTALRGELEQVASRLKQLRLWRGLSLVWILASAVGAVLWLTGSHAASGAGTVRAVVTLTGLLAVLSALQAWLFAPGEKEAAHAVEKAFPELNSTLLTALQLKPDNPDGRFGFLQSSVILQAFSHSSMTNWANVVSPKRMWRAIGGHFLSLAFLGGTLWALGKSDTSNAAATVSRTQPTSNGLTTAFSFEIEPGNTEVERGSSLLVLARVTGPLPTEGILVHSPSTEPTSAESRLPLTRSLNDPVFGARIGTVQGPLRYHVELDGKSSPTYEVTVFEYPRLERADACLSYPDYTGLEPRRLQDVRSLSVVEGTNVRLECVLNKVVPTAELTETDQPSIPLIASSDQPTLYTATIPTDRSRKLTVRLQDESGRSNTQIAEIRIQVVPNQPATVKPVFPARDIEASPLEEIDLKATVWDDFGIPRAGVTYSLAGRPPMEAILAEQVAGKNRQEMFHAIPLEDLKAQPDELVAYYFWAEDVGPDGQIRRTLGDMYFAEVRHFEEIFRQGEAQPGGEQSGRQPPQGQGQGQSPNANAAQDLAELQKQIINATWKVIRREIADKLTPSFADDIRQIAESQQQALSQARGLAERVTDSESQGHLERVTKAMQEAALHLEEAQEDQAREPLPQALIYEQAASQALLKLRAREHEITRQQQQQQQPGQQANRGRSAQQRQQLDQLDLKEDENRYETQRMAQSQQDTTAEREDRQVLNRLRELAQRQHDLNDQLKDLQSALEAADSDKKKEEVRRQLQRLQEEQQQILRDTDELQTRMDAPENQQRMQEQRQQLEQAREQVQRAAESLRDEQATRAAAAGTRAEQSFEELREEFRRQSSGRFQETVREIVDEVRQLDTREQEVRRQIEQAISPDTDNRTLRNDTNREKIAEEINQQRTRLNDLVERMQQTITDAEESEPLLAEKLYDAAREVQSQSVPQALDATRQSLQRGLLEDAQQLEQRAGRGIEQVREKIEGAAESVLGDETESLRRAREELRNLSREVNDELRRNQTGSEAPQDADTRGNTRSDVSESEGTRQSQSGEAGSEEPASRQASSEDATSRQPRRGPSSGSPASAGSPESNARAATDDRSQSESDSTEESESGDQQAGPEGNPRQSGQQRGPMGRNGRPGVEEPDQNARNSGSGEADRSSESDEEETSPVTLGNSGNRAQRPGNNSSGARSPSVDPRSESNPSDDEGTENPVTQQSSTRQTQQSRRGGNRQTEAPNRNPGDAQQRSPGIGPPDQLADPGGFAPFTGRDFRDWSDRLRDVEEMVSDPELRAEAARIRDRARAIRGEARRNSAEPNWDLVRMQVANPLAELSRRVNDELLRRQNRQNVIPLDRDQVPPRYSEKTRKYYERLGSGQ